MSARGTALAPWRTDDGRLAPRADAVSRVALVIVPAALVVFVVATAWSRGTLGFDMKDGLLPAAERIAAGDSPYAGLTYPPLVPFLLVPFSYLGGAHVLLAFLALATVPLSLWALGVSDWRCYAAALAWGPVLSGVQTANPTLFLVLAAALTWRYRDRFAAAAAATGLAVAAKVISLPFTLWLLATGRLRAGIATVVVAVATTGVLVAVVQLVLDTSASTGITAGIGNVPEAESTPSYGVVDIVRALGGTTAAGLAAVALVAGALILLGLRYGRRGEDLRAFAAAAAATLVIAPNVWLHSFSFLLLAVALLRPRLSGAWLAPALFVFMPVVDPTWFDTVFVWAIAAGVLLALLVRPAPGGRPTVAAETPLGD